MDVSRYEFPCQKAFHQGLQYARSLGHERLEVEHIALALLRADAIELGNNAEARLQHHLQKELSRWGRTFGNIKIEFGKRLDHALDEAEERSGKHLIGETLLWECLIAQSEIIKAFFGAAAKPESTDAFEETKIPEVTKPKKIIAPRKEKEKEREKDKAPNKEETTQGTGDEAAEEEEVSNNYQIPEKLAKVLSKYTIDLTALAERGELDPVVGRDSETRRVLEILGRKKKNNPILIGEPGVGKTAVAESLALRIAEGRVPEPMKGKRVLSLDLGGLVAGARFRGEFEERMKNLLAAVQACGGEIILFIDEIHMIVGAGSAEGSADAANLMKPALARGELRCLGATTLDEYRQHIEKDPALERRFQAVMVEEPSRSATLSILRGIKGRYEVHHGVQINDEALVKAVDLSIRYLAGRQLPDKAIDLMDEACSRLRIQIDSVPAIMDDLRSQIDQLEIEKKAIGADQTGKASLSKLEVALKDVTAKYKDVEKIWRNHQVSLETLRKLESRHLELSSLFENSKGKGDFEFAAKLQYVEIPKLDESLATVKAELETLQKQYSWLRQVVGGIEIAEVIANWTHIPIDRLVKEDAKALLDMEKRMSKRVFGQPHALATVSKAIRRARLNVNDPRRPLGVFLFVGPTGVGKTETVKALAEEVFDDENRMVRLDMSEFMEQHNIARLIGSPPGYIGYGEGGELTEPVRRTPYTVVLFDEIEKAHPRVMDILLQAFDDGRLTDSNGRLVSFKNTLMVMTSNIPLEPSNNDDDLRAQLSKVMRPEFVGRIDEVVLFDRLGRTHLENLLDKQLIDFNHRLTDRQLRVVLGPKLIETIMNQAAVGQFGGRALRRAFENLVIDQVSNHLLREYEPTKGAWLLDIGPNGDVVWHEDFSLDRYLPPAS